MEAIEGEGRRQKNVLKSTVQISPQPMYGKEPLVA